MAQVENLVSKVELGLAYGMAETINGSVLMIASPIAGLLYNIEQKLPFIVSLVILGFALFTTWRFTPLKPQSRSIHEGSIDQDS
jgi:hypothetical protein